jgi:hypothetical protein
MTLQQATLANVDDAAGRWQFEGGEVLRQGNRVADYAATRMARSRPVFGSHVRAAAIQLCATCLL